VFGCSARGTGTLIVLLPESRLRSSPTPSTLEASTRQSNSVFGSKGCGNKVAQSRWLKPQQCLTTLGCKSPKVWAGLVPSGGSEGASVPCLPPSLCRLPGGLRRALLTRHSSSVWIHVQISPFQKTHPTPVGPHPN